MLYEVITLEQRLGEPLFVRRSRPLALTAPGRLLWQLAEQVLPAIDRITSYNVCYTKLLRAGRAAQLIETGAPHWPLDSIWCIWSGASWISSSARGRGRLNRKPWL